MRMMAGTKNPGCVCPFSQWYWCWRDTIVSMVPLNTPELTSRWTRPCRSLAEIPRFRARNMRGICQREERQRERHAPRYELSSLAVCLHLALPALRRSCRTLNTYTYVASLLHRGAVDQGQYAAYHPCLITGAVIDVSDT